jgi:hypothetical protein
MADHRVAACRVAANRMAARRVAARRVAARRVAGRRVAAEAFFSLSLSLSLSRSLSRSYVLLITTWRLYLISRVRELVGFGLRGIQMVFGVGF